MKQYDCGDSKPSSREKEALCEGSGYLYDKAVFRLRRSGAIFAAIAVAHLARLILGFEIVVGGVVAPPWVSFPGALIAALLAVWMAAAARRS